MGQIPTRLNGVDELNDQQLAVICDLLASQTGQSLIESYKTSCVKRRIASRIRRSGCLDVEGYLDLLRSDPEEGLLLAASLSIHVSQFFRNPSLFDLLQARILPELVKRRVGQTVRFWSVGCSAGQEPYSLAILLAESFEVDAAQARFQILATDIDATVLALAAQGQYQERAVSGVTPKRLHRFFLKSEQGFSTCAQLRSLVSFKQMDLQQFDQYQPADLVICRNTLIYFNRPSQEKILNSFADILPQDGILVLGKSENMPNALRNRFMTLDPVERIYGLL